MNYYEHHLGDYVRDTAHLSMLEDGAYRRLIDAYYTREKPLPSDIKDVCRLARAITKPERDAVKVVLEEFFFQSPEGWRHKRCDAEITRYQEKQPSAEAKRENDRERQRRSRDRRKTLFETLRVHGYTAPWDATTEKLQELVSRILSPPVTQPVTRDNTATQAPSTSHQTPDLIPTKGSGARNSAESSLGTTPGTICRALKSAGLQRVNPTNPDLKALIEEGATEQEFVDAAQDCLGKSNEFAYLLAVVKGRRADAAKPAKPTNGTHPPYRETFRERDARLAAERMAELAPGVADWSLIHRNPNQPIIDITERSNEPPAIEGH